MRCQHRSGVNPQFAVAPTGVPSLKPPYQPGRACEKSLFGPWAVGCPPHSAETLIISRKRPLMIFFWLCLRRLLTACLLTSSECQTNTHIWDNPPSNPLHRRAAEKPAPSIHLSSLCIVSKCEFNCHWKRLKGFLICLCMSFSINTGQMLHVPASSLPSLSCVRAHILGKVLLW